METKIKEVENYFKSKLFNKDFKITEILEHTLTVLIDEKYEFVIWIGNHDIPSTRELYEGSYMKFPLTQKERIKLHGVFSKDVRKFRNEPLLREKKSQYENLKKELGI